MLANITIWISSILDWFQAFVRPDWFAPAVVLGIIGIFVNQFGSWYNNKTKIRAEDGLADKKFGYEQQSADKKFIFDKQLAQLKLDLDKEIAQRKSEIDKDQLVHKRRFELAEALLADAYHFRDLMGFVRNGFTLGDEGNSRKQQKNELENEKSKRNSYFVPVERLQKENDFIGSFFSKQYAAQAQFGTEMAQAFMLFSQAIVEIRTASQMLIEGVGRYNEDLEFTNHLLEQIWAGYSTVRKKEDVIAKKIIDGIAIFEKLCKPVLEWKGA